MTIEAPTHSGQALRAIQGERRAHDFLARLEVQKADADELAMIVAKLYGAELRGFVRVLVRALQQPMPDAGGKRARALNTAEAAR